MSDMREKQPAVRVFDAMPASNYEVELKAWPYHSIQSEDVISPKLVYRIHADDFGAAHRMAILLRDTVRSMHDIWKSEIVRIEEINR